MPSSNRFGQLLAALADLHGISVDVAVRRPLLPDQENVAVGQLDCLQTGDILGDFVRVVGEPDDAAVALAGPRPTAEGVEEAAALRHALAEDEIVLALEVRAYLDQGADVADRSVRLPQPGHSAGRIHPGAVSPAKTTV